MNYADTFFIKQKDRLFDSHLWVVVSDPFQDSEKVLIVSVASWDPDKDQSCILQIGDHPLLPGKRALNTAIPR